MSVMGSVPANCGVAGWHRWCQDRDISVGEVGSWLVGTLTCPGSEYYAGWKGGDPWSLGKGGSCQSISPSLWIPSM